MNPTKNDDEKKLVNDVYFDGKTYMLKYHMVDYELANGSIDDKESKKQHDELKKEYLLKREKWLNEIMKYLANH